MLEKLKGRIRDFFHCYKAAKLFIGMFQEKGFLEPGDYFIINNVRSYLIKKETPKEFLKMIGVEGKGKEQCHFHMHVSQGLKSPLKAQVVMSTNNQFRFFDYDNNLTFRRFYNKEEHERYIECKNRFGPFFNMTFNSIVGEYCVDNFVKNVPRNLWNEKMMIEIFYALLENYIRYLHSADSKLVSVKEVTASAFPELYDYRLIHSILTKEVKSYNCTKTVFGHGDLHFGNILFDGVRFYLIDFEMAKEEVFFYDLFNVMYVEAVDMKNYMFLDFYMTADSRLMNCFTKAFEAVGEVFDINRREEYLKLYLLLRLNSSAIDTKRKYYGKQLKEAIMFNVKRIDSMLQYITEQKIL